ncbi:ATP-dependent DNA helicase [Cellvibrio sp. BR]|uniref:UvrD-helicase domain-containing protein n=1 Tax=Cellvibrio sp. BR TaxID=1134474 RepID=UPI00026017BB|nr:ATP-dependent helicase [Cellvibrio sp. BR]EIK44157.1 ATP-dependent DNA helicase [Cellvibrio sp. BR]
MMSENSQQQQDIIDAPLTSMSIIACAGSGKTHTAVRRLAEMRRQLGEHRGRVALLSFSNVAVDTFTKGYRELYAGTSVSSASNRVEIDTLDSFIIRNVIHPHAHRTMQSNKAPYLVTGGEQFLNGFTFWNGKFPVCISHMHVGISNNIENFYYSQNEKIVQLDRDYSLKLVQRLGCTGAYTHNLGRYWCYRTLRDQPGVLRALVTRYPYILIDEAQDIGTMHQSIIELLMTAGVRVSLIGDPNQGIYEFAGADGKFLSEFGNRQNVVYYPMTRNYRSVPLIMDVANRISARNDEAHRNAPDSPHGAFYIPYKTADREKMIESFRTAVIAAGLSIENSAVLCRGRELADKLAGRTAPDGQGLIKSFALASLNRDKHQDYLGAFKLVTKCIVGLLAEPPSDLVTMIIQPNRYPEIRQISRLIWGFTRDANIGLPSSNLRADKEWHPLLLARVKVLLITLDQKYGLKSAENLGNKLSKKGLTDAPLIDPNDLVTGQGARLRVDTVHQVKGESLDGVLYITTKEHITALLAGVNSELGRIGYVAITRARNLLWVGVPESSLKEFKPALEAHGFQLVGST